MKELIKRINELLEYVIGFKKQLEDKDNKILELQNIINLKDEEIEKLKIQELDLTELNDAISKLEEVLNA